MKNLYEFLEFKYFNDYDDYCDDCDDEGVAPEGFVDFDDYVDMFMKNTFYADKNTVHEGFFNEGLFAGTFVMSYKLDHKNRKIEILMEAE